MIWPILSWTRACPATVASRPTCGSLLHLLNIIEFQASVFSASVGPDFLAALEPGPEDMLLRAARKDGATRAQLLEFVRHLKSKRCAEGSLLPLVTREGVQYMVHVVWRVSWQVCSVGECLRCYSCYTL